MIFFEEEVALRPLEKPPLYWRNDPSVWEWTRQNDLICESEHDAWFGRQAKDPSIKMYGVFLDRDQVGVCGLTSVSLQNRNAEFSLYLIPQFRKMGLGKKTLITLFSHGFMNMGLKSIWGETFEDNPAQKTFEAIGMKRDGVRRQFYWKDGRFKDAILFSMLDSEFITRHGRRSCFRSSAPAS